MRVRGLMPVRQIRAADFTPLNLTLVNQSTQAQLLENNSDCCTFRGGKGAQFGAVCTRAVNIMLNSSVGSTGINWHHSNPRVLRATFSKQTLSAASPSGLFSEDYNLITKYVKSQGGINCLAGAFAARYIIKI